MISQYFVDLVDDAGYLPPDVSDAALRLGAAPAQIEAVLTQLQTFDPPGVCARSLAECLGLQLRELDRLDPAMEALLGHLELVAKRDFSALRKICGVDEEDLVEMIGEIKGLNPNAWVGFSTARVRPDVPCGIVPEAPDGRW